MGIHVKTFIPRAKEYVELEGRMKVLSVRFAERFTLLGRTDVVVAVRTTDEKDPDWWVVGGGTPMNLYSKRVFRSADEAFSMHTGLMLRMTANDFSTSSASIKKIARLLADAMAHEERN